jgi:hypothetical protein
MFNTGFLFASLFWGSIGAGYCIYGKKQRLWPPMAGGMLMVVASYLAASVLMMSLICAALIAAVYFLIKQGF